MKNAKTIDLNKYAKVKRGINKSVYLTLEQNEFILENSLNLSAIVREAIEQLMVKGKIK